MAVLNKTLPEIRVFRQRLYRKRLCTAGLPAKALHAGMIRWIQGIDGKSLRCIDDILFSVFPGQINLISDDLQ